MPSAPSHGSEMRYTGFLILIGSLLVHGSATAATYNGTPATYRSIVPNLQAGDTLVLAAGAYADGLDVYGLRGTSAAWITITGPSSGSPAIFLGDPGQGRNTIEIVNSSYIAIKRLTVDAQNIPDVFGISCKDGTSNVSHDILIEGCRIINHGASQQTVGISTKSPTWNWTIRGNEIAGAGTGMYLGNSDGSDPFVAGVIENNLITDAVGYCMQIKHQNPRPAVSGMPTGRSVTVIRNNVFIKNDATSPDGDRPNVLVGPFPSSGAGSTDLYEIYGNFFFHNPRESLLQASGRVTIHDNILVDAVWSGIYLTDHNGPLQLAHVYSNTIYSAASGIRFNNAADVEGIVVGNLVFSPDPISGPASSQVGNVTDSVASAANYVTNPGLNLGAIDFYPLAGRCQGAPLDLSGFAGETEYERDFNGRAKGGFTFRGAYAGEGTNPGWRLQRGFKDTGTPPPPPGEKRLSVTVTGLGLVTSDPAGISCPRECQHDFANRASVTLDATAASGNEFDHWEGDCSGADPRCQLVMSANRAVTAVFIPRSGGSTLTILSPNGGEKWVRGRRARIAWSSSGIGGNVRIDLSVDGGSRWRTILTSTPNDGSERWRVKGGKSENALVRIRSIANPSIFDISDTSFTIR